MDLLKLEQQRQALEANLQKLRQSLKHWQTWEAEYEGLKEEIVNMDSELTPDELANIANTYVGDLVDQKEIRELSGLDKDSPRTAKQIIGLIERRQEYVQKNIETVQRQYFDAEAKSEELAFAAATHGGTDEAGLPLTEIHEELDEDGNVVSSRLSQPEEATAKVVESLRKAGLSEDDLAKTPEAKHKPEDLKPAITNASPIATPGSTPNVEKRSSDTAMASPTSDTFSDDLERPTVRKKSVSFTADTKEASEKPRTESEDGKKSVSFNEKVAVMPAAPPPDTRSVSFSPKVEEIPAEPLETGPVGAQQLSQDDIKKAKQLMHADDSAEGAAATSAEEAVIPDDESPEDARLRRDMLEYHLNEVGSVVAQIDLHEAEMDTDADEGDDNSSYRTTSEYLDDDDTPYTTGLSDSEESEDEFGRSKGPQITPEYRKQMEELQKRLIGNLGPTPQDEDVEDADPDLDPQDVRRLVVRSKRNSTSSASSDNSEKKSAMKKRVSFAEELDVAEPGSPPLKAQKIQDSENIAPIAETISERAPAPSHSKAEEPPTKKVSKFKQARTAETETTDEDTKSTSAPIAHTLQERPLRSNSAKAPSTDDPDPISQRRELAAEYYRRRNDMIKQQGGFKADDDEEELMEEDGEGRVKKVSRFKAARIKS